MTDHHPSSTTDHHKRQDDDDVDDDNGDDDNRDNRGDVDAQNVSTTSPSRSGRRVGCIMIEIR